MLVGFFNEFGDAEEAVGNLTRAQELRDLSGGIAKAVNQYLWDPIDNDLITSHNSTWMEPHETLLIRSNLACFCSRNRR